VGLDPYVGGEKAIIKGPGFTDEKPVCAKLTVNDMQGP
jgi:hypothetical protein